MEEMPLYLPTPTQDFLVGCLPPSRSRRKIWNVSCSFPVLSHFVIHVFQPVKIRVFKQEYGCHLHHAYPHFHWLPFNFDQFKNFHEFCRSLREIRFVINQVRPAVGSFHWLVVFCDHAVRLVSFHIFHGVWKPNSKFHLSAAWCLL